MSNKLLLTEFIELTPNRDLLTEEEKKRMDNGRRRRNLSSRRHAKSRRN